MPTPIFYTDEVYNFSELPYPLEVGAQPSSGLSNYDTHVHPEVGLLTYSNMAFPYLHISDMHWKTGKALQLHNNIASDSVHFVFQTGGRQCTVYNNLSWQFGIDRGQHYFVYTPEDGFYNEVSDGAAIDVFHLTLEKPFFMAVLGQGDRWSADLLNRLEQKRCAAGSSQPLEITPPMWQLIQQLKSLQGHDPVSKLQLQSMALELIALQVEQSRNAEQQQECGMKAGEKQKLEQLKAYLEVHYLSELSLARLSQEALLNEFKLKKGFKQLFGTTVFGYLRTLRMNHAATLLQQGMPIGDVALLLGYEHTHHFATAFKSYMGVSPTGFVSGKQQ